MENKLLFALEAELHAGNTCVLATIVERYGSVPRGVGTSMLLATSREQMGTLGGGSLEARAREDARALLASRQNAIKPYQIHADEKSVFSGGVKVLFRVFSGEAGLSLCDHIKSVLEREEEAYLVCELSNQGATYSEVLPARELLIRFGLTCPPEQVIITQSEPLYLIEPLLPAPRVVLFGGGHVARCMAAQLNLLEARVWVVEDREEFAKARFFPAAERIIHADYASAGEILRLTKRDHAIVMSRGHETDEQILRWLLRGEIDYVGCIGSRKKITLLRERLLADGVTSEQLERLHAPVGLRIGAETPAEIAVSVAAEWIQHCACKQTE